MSVYTGSCRRAERGARSGAEARLAARSARPVDDEVGELHQRGASAAERSERGDAVVAQLPRPCARVLEPDGAGVSRLGMRGIGTGRLAEHCRIALDIENVVLDLEGETDVGTKALEAGELRSAAHTGRERATQYARLNPGT